jgi:hypothetical protein
MKVTIFRRKKKLEVPVVGDRPEKSVERACQ